MIITKKRKAGIRLQLIIFSTGFEFDWETKAAKIGIFSDGDEYFSFEKEFEHIFGTSVGKNHFKIHGTHEIAKDMTQLTDAISQAWDYLERVNSGYEPGDMFV